MRKKFLPPDEATKFRQLIARCNFMSQDRPDVQYAVKEIARGMANPRLQDWERLIRLGKYSAGKPRYVIVYGRKKTCMQFTILVIVILQERSKLGSRHLVAYAVSVITL